MNSKTSHAERFVAYLRVSTGKQARSGLGMEAQEAAIQRFIEQRPGSRLLKTFRENRSGADDGRPELRAALCLCRRIGATLLVAKLDRISRRQGFLIDLRDSGQPFKLADMPDLDEKMLPFFMMISTPLLLLLRLPVINLAKIMISTLFPPLLLQLPGMNLGEMTKLALTLLTLR